MSSSDEDEDGDTLSEIDFSVISTSIKVGGTVVNQIVNSINYGSPEVRYLLQEECDVIIECKVCRNLFRSIPMFVAHKRIYCQQFSAATKENVVSSQPEEEVVVVHPESADVPVEGEGRQKQKSTIDRLLEGTFHGTSEAYRLYTQHAQRVESQKAYKTVSTINVTEIPTNPNAVQISVQKNVVNQSDNVLQNGSPSDNGGTQIKRSNKVSDNRSELMKELSKKTEKSPELLKDKLGKSEGMSNLDSQKGKGVSKNLELRPVKSQDATLCELRELENMGHCDIKKLQCLICQMTFVAKKGLLQHMHWQHSSRKTIYPCHLCSSKFKYFWGLTRHLKITHEKTKTQVDRLRKKLRASAYTILVDGEFDNSTDTNEMEDKSVSSQTEAMEVTVPSKNSDNNKKVSRTSRGITLNKCGGCGKAFWKRQSYDDHTKQCKWLATTSNNEADNTRHSQVKKNDVNTGNQEGSMSGKNEDRNEKKTREKSKKESPVLADSQKAAPERFIKTRSESNTRGNEARTRSESNESRNSSRNEKFTQENRSRGGNTQEVVKNRNNEQRGSTRNESESRDRSNSSSSRNEKFTQENRSRSGNTRDGVKNTKAETTRSQSRDRSNSSSSRNEKFTQENRSRSGNTRDGVKNTKAETTRSQSRDRSNSCSSRNEKFTQENRSRSGNTRDGVKNTKAETTRSQSRDRSNSCSSRNEKFTQENRSRSGNTRDGMKDRNKDQMAETTRSRSRSDVSRTSNRDRSDSSRSVSRDRKGSISSDVGEKQMVTRNIATRRGECERKPVISKTTNEKSSSKSRKSDESVPDSDSEMMSRNSGSTRRIGTRSSTVENDEVDGSSKSTSPSSKIQCDPNLADGSKQAKEVNSIEASRKSTRRSDAQKSKDIQSQVSSRNSSVERDLVEGTRKNISTRRSDDATTKKNERALKNSDSYCPETDNRQTVDETTSDVTSTGNTYIIDGVEISEVTEAQINARKTVLKDETDHENDWDDLDDVISETASETKHYLRSSQKETTKEGSAENRLSSSTENLHLDIGAPKTERNSSSERRSRTSAVSSQKQSPSSVVEKKSMETDRVATKDTSVSAMRHVLRSRDKADTTKNKDENQAPVPPSGAQVDNSIFDPNNEMLEAQETINSLQNFPDIQMITRRSLETFRPKDEETAEEKSDEISTPAMATRKSERQKSLAVDENKTQENVVNESQKSVTHSSKKSIKDDIKYRTVYVCIFCPKEFSYYWGITRHLRLKHHKSKKEIPLLWNKLKAKSYLVNEETVKRIFKTKNRPMKVDSGKTKTRLRRLKNSDNKSENVSSVKTRDNRHTRSQENNEKIEPTSVKKLTDSTRKRIVRTSESSSVCRNQTLKISPKSDNTAAKSLKCPASVVKTDNRIHEREQVATYNTRKSVDHLGSSSATDRLSRADNVGDGTASEKLYHGSEINSNSNKVCIEEIWVGKEPGQPSKSIRCQKVIIESESGKSLLSKMTVRRRKSQVNSPKSKEKGTRKMYVVDPSKSSQPRCLDSKRVDALICENHTTAEQYCLQCGMVFSNVSNLRRHIVRHLGWKRYKCKLCSFASYNKSECSTHLRRIHAEKLLGGSVQSYVIDLNKEASKLRTEKKQNTMSLRKTDSMPGGTSCKSYWYRDRNAKRVPLKITNSSRGDADLEENDDVDDSSRKKKKTSQKKNEDRKKPGVNVKNIKQITSSSNYNISTRNSARTFDTSPYKEKNEMETLMTRKGHYPKDEKISLRSKRDILNDIDNENVLPKPNSKLSPCCSQEANDSHVSKAASSQVATDSQISKANSGSDSVVRDRPVVRKRKRSDSEGHDPQEVEDGNDNEIDSENSGNKASPSGSKSKEIKQNEAKWKLKRSFSHDGIPPSQVINDEMAEFSSKADGGQSSKLEKKYSELRQVETDVRLTPSLKTMMAALEEARATVTVKKRRRTLKRSISPGKKIQRVSSVDGGKDRFRRHSLDVLSKTGASASEDDVNLDNESVDENVDDDGDDNDDDDGVQSVNQLGANDDKMDDGSKDESDKKEEGNHGNKTLSRVSDTDGQNDIAEKSVS